jgi:hypothetical protein
MSKYGAKKTVIDGITFDSKREAQYYAELKLLRRAGQIKDIQLQPVYEIHPAYKKGKKKIQAITYKADFLVTYSDGHTEVIDVKGVLTEVYRIKKKMFEYKYGIEIKEIS